MSLPYRAVQLNDAKLMYDGVLLAGIFVYLLLFLAASLLGQPTPDPKEIATALTRAFGSLAILLLHVTLAIGPLARLNQAFLPLLANRRHLGVVTFLIAGTHGVLATLLYHSNGAMNPLASTVMGHGQFLTPHEFPFEVFGFGALLILAVLAATSHNFWIACLGLSLWKRIHMLVFVAYVLVLLHTGLGAIQGQGNPGMLLALAGGSILLLSLHLSAARQEQRKDESIPEADREGWLRVARVEEIPEERAVIVSTGKERVAVFRHWQGVSAVSNVCAHQGGPLGEGQMQAGCIRCPWHGALYFPHNGSSPPPFEKSVATYNLKVEDGVVYLDPKPNPPGMPVEPIAKPVRRKAGRV
jgi:methionine sulfoxide reductase heme-binding subunit